MCDPSHLSFYFINRDSFAIKRPTIAINIVMTICLFSNYRTFQWFLTLFYLRRSFLIKLS